MHEEEEGCPSSHTASSTPPTEGAAGKCCYPLQAADGRSLLHAWLRRRWSTNNPGLLQPAAGRLDAAAGSVCMSTLLSCRRHPHPRAVKQRRDPEAAADQRQGPEPALRPGLWVAEPVCSVDWRCDAAVGGTPLALQLNYREDACCHRWSFAEYGLGGSSKRPGVAVAHAHRGPTGGEFANRNLDVAPPSGTRSS